MMTQERIKQIEEFEYNDAWEVIGELLEAVKEYKAAYERERAGRIETEHERSFPGMWDYGMTLED